MTGAVFLDRDGTLLVERHYLADPEGVEFIPGALEALGILRSLGYRLIVVTNQSGIGRGMYSEDDYRRVAKRVDERLAEAGHFLDGTYYCPHHPDSSDPCQCRKPATGMYEAAARELEVSLADSWYVGDRIRDVLPALALGGKGILVRTGYGLDEEPDLPEGVAVADDLSAAACLIAGKAEIGTA